MKSFEPNEKFAEVVSLLKSGKIDTHKRTADFDEYKEFIKKFPASDFTSLSLDEYCMGKGNKTNFCWWLEQGLNKVMGTFSPGSAKGHIIYFLPNGDLYKNKHLIGLSDNEALIYTLRIQSTIVNIDPTSDVSWIDNDDEIYKHAGVEKLVTVGNARKLRLLSCYHPDVFLPISSSIHLGHFLKIFGYPDNSIPNSDKPIARMLLLMELYKLACLEIKDLSTFAFMLALYNEELNIAPKKHEDLNTDMTPKIWKISHGKPNKDISDEDHKWLIENRYVAIGWVDEPKNPQRKKFDGIQSTDYFYLVRNTQIILLGQLEDEPSVEIERVAGRLCRKFKLITLLNLMPEDANLPKRVVGYKMDEPFNSSDINCSDQLKNKKFMPSGQRTVQEVEEDYLGEFEKWLLKPVFNLNLEDLFIPSSSDKRLDNSITPKGNEMFSLNQILFGPPGTGKTFNTVNKAIAIANPSFELNQPRLKVKAEFDRLMEEGQIVFTTFHQSMGYEDFIEGIKPETTPDDKRVIYNVKPGIFKNLCQAAITPNLIGFNAAYEQLIKKLSEFEDTGSDTTEVKTIEIKTPTGKPFSISLNSNNNLSLHTGPNKIKQGTLTRENIQAQINGDVKFIGWNGYFEGVCNYLKENYNYSSTSENTAKNFVLIIDEINRGNVSQIFGELITLIEYDKRLGCPEALVVTLPYSKEKFGVPSNLYIIGTMNTADRSVEALDAALRRRFSFEEMPPNSKLIATDGELKDTMGKLGEINLPSLLDIINQRIEKLLDKDHQIGHSYFMPVKDLDGLKLAFQKKIIPLLQEYFFGDYGKIGLVLGKGFFVGQDELNKYKFAEFDFADANDFSDRIIYKIKTFEIGEKSNDNFIKAINLLLNKKTNEES